MPIAPGTSWRLCSGARRGARHVAGRSIRDPVGVRKPALTSVIVISLALGIGANTTIFTVINAVFLRPLPVRDPARLVQELRSLFVPYNGIWPRLLCDRGDPDPQGP